MNRFPRETTSEIPVGGAFEELTGFRLENCEHRADAIRVLRGGSFYLNAVWVRSASRNWSVLTDRYANVGFRPARTFR